MKKQKLIGALVFIVLMFSLAPLSSFAGSGKILANSYLSHFIPGEPVSFSVTFKNTGGFDNVYLDVVLTNRVTGAEEVINLPPLVYPGSDTKDMNGGDTTILTTSANVPPINGGNNLSSGRRALNWTARPGSFTVTLIVYSTGGGNPELARVYGATLVEVGPAKDSVAAFPKILDLGPLQYGRVMNPTPIEISWSFSGFASQIRTGQPWYMRIYTDNHNRYGGIKDAVYSGRVSMQQSYGADAAGSPAGLVSSDGKYVIPLKCWCLNFGPDVEDGWDTNLMGPPPVKEDSYWKGILLDTGKRDLQRAPWQWIPDYIDMSADNSTWRKLIGQDQFNTHYKSDSNPTGDFTLPSPFQLFIAYETSPTAVVGKYSTDLILEIYSP